MRLQRFLSRFLLLTAAALAAHQATATVTSAQVYVDLGTGDTVLSNSVAGGREGVAISVDQGLIAHAEAAGYAGGLKVASVAHDGATAQADAGAAWADTFAVRAFGYSSGTRGTFSAAVAVQGGLRAEFTGRTYADAYVVANFSIDTGIDNGHLAAQGGGRRSAGYDTGSSSSGQESFLLYFDNVPFAFDEDIGTSLALRTVAGIIGDGTGSSYASAEYGHTMTWAGLSNVRDSSGRLVTEYSAVSADSGFNFAALAPVPEPESWALIAVGMFLVTCRLRQRQDSRARTRGIG